MWIGRLPGTRVLAGHYHVHRDTVDAAIAILEASGVVEAAEPRRARRILWGAGSGEREKKEGKKRLLLIHRGLFVADREDLLILQRMDGLWRSRYGEVVWEQVDYLAGQTPEKRLAALVKKHSVNAILLHVPPVTWSRAAAELLPTYCCGGSSPDEKSISLSAYHAHEQLKLVLRRLVGLGHRRILVPTLDIKGDFAKVAVQALKEELPGPPVQGTYEDLCPACLVMDSGSWFEYWKRELNRTQATSVVLWSTRHLLSLYSYCFQYQIAIPRQLSVVLFSYDEHMEWLRPQPVMFRYPNNKAVRHFERWIDKGLSPIGSRFFDLEMIPGQSIAKVEI
ncbi:DNA-binding transcriptional regulator, LacI/PurR family [Rubritalea squalenifaciens DSM 18772]|uniref:DNA-binding transcriptional regulator, LacI/PurR family n=2 Tax=Rubritalea squalenifaciens TaxID=407226 RepID=A0A1M6KV51_9BACT|nr:DNA-binding transcriptional regulator, LacI/PurR family [Rubritalea squalenifaciens DSM 18772]